MLHLQRASAGSGKTYALAKTFIRLLISISIEGGPRRLRTDAELTDSVNHILAVTFTNKATNEMQQRIIEKLAALAKGANPEDVETTDYLKDLMTEFHASQKEINEVCAKALKQIIINYSDFNVATIDSFFQTILRTFAYEAELNDSYSLEIDNSYVANVALDEVLDEVITTGGEPEIVRWLTLLIDDLDRNPTEKNVFQRNRNKGLYSILLSDAKNLDKEEFKQIRIALDNYFSLLRDSNTDLFEVMKAWDAAMLKASSGVTVAGKRAAGRFIAMVEGGGERQLEKVVTSATARKIRALASGTPESTPLKIADPEALCLFVSKTGIGKALKTFDAETLETLNDLYREIVKATDSIVNFDKSGEGYLWSLYRSTLPRIALLHHTQQRMDQYLDTSNTLQLSDTNTLLRRIIGEEDAPFIYERIGTRINHFLIDEFQDTSLMQWQNFEPLLNESLSRKNSNLIIGDAKQSIYRFRNAEPSLISKIVPEKYDTLPSADDIPAERVDMQKLNTNWRSDLRIIDFNNFFFHTLSKRFTGNLARLYDNCIQPASPKAQKKKRGYVEINIKDGFEELPGLIRRLIDRGYRKKDICVLVRTNDHGDEAVKTLIDYNASESGLAAPIDFISDENLKIGASTAVKIIISGLETLARGDRRDDTAIDDRLAEMMKQLPTLALPMLVEALAEEFVDEEIRATEAPYMAAFMDAVIDYTDNYNPDIASFLDWWQRRGSDLSVNSPEDTDAVRIITVHKSKGLEYKCVIIPKADFAFGPSPMKSEWVWTKPDTTGLCRIMEMAGIDTSALPPLPPKIPLETKKNVLADTPHFSIWRDYQEKVCQDGLNTAYVAFTRAVNELYVYASRAGRVISSAPVEDTSTGNIQEDRSRDFMSQVDEMMEICPLEVVPIYAEKEEEEEGDTERKEESKPEVEAYLYGSPLTTDEIDEIYKRKGGSIGHDDAKDVVIESYYVSKMPDNLYTQESEVDAPVGVEQAVAAAEEEIPLDIDDDQDPRSEGRLLHAVMEHIHRRKDLDRALLRLMTRGMITSSTAAEWKMELGRAIDFADDEYGWFSGKYKVLSERSLLNRRGGTLRPDRVMVNSEGDAVVVDFKFGRTPKVSSYGKQVQGYKKALAKAGNFRSVKGYLWYVRLNEIIEIS